MKRIISVFLAAITILILALPCGAAHAEPQTEVETIYLADGGYVEIVTDSVQTIASNTITKNKHYIRYNESKEAVWKATLTGTFTYNGTTSSCTSSSCSVTIYENIWYLVSKSSTRSGNTAYATVTMGRKFLGVTVDKETYNITLTCDKNGNVS